MAPLTRDPGADAVHPAVEAGEQPELDLGAENAALKAANEALERRLARMEALLAGTASASPAERVAAGLDEGAEPVFDPDAPHGVVWGDTEVAYVQNGHQFSHDRRYLRTEANRGVPRPFNPKLVGFVRRPKPLTLD
jgi:hypothetical protein